MVNIPKFLLKIYLVVAIVMTTISFFSFSYTGKMEFDTFIYIMNILDWIVYITLWNYLKREKKK
jgi:hypothetical protein